MFFNLIRRKALKSRGKLLVTTSINVLLININDNSFSQVHSGSGLYYGIAREEKKKNVYVLARNNENPFSYLSQNERIKEKSKILRFNKRFSLVEEIYPPNNVTDFHQGIYHDKKLWLTYTIANAIYIYDFNSWETWFPLESEGKRGDDINHFNSIIIKDNIIHLLAHNFGSSEVYLFDRKSKALIRKIELGSCAHNIWFDKHGEMWVCDSNNESILSETGKNIKLDGFTRGVAESDGFLFIGSSGISERSERQNVNSKIYVLDKMYNVDKIIPVNGFGQILDIHYFEN